MNDEKRQVSTESAAVLIMLAVFAVCILFVLFSGTKIYKSVSDRDLDNHTSRTAAQYIVTKVRQADRRGYVSAESFGGRDALVIREDIEGEAYVTKLYCYDGWLMELFCEEGAQLSPIDGQRVTEAEEFEAEKDGNTINARITAGGIGRSLTLYLRSEGEGAQ